LARPVGGYAEQYDPLGLPLVVRSVALRADAELPAGTAVELAVRTGTSPVYEPQRWSDWRPAGAALAAGHRYLQWQATLRSSDPLATPRLRGVAVEAQLLRPAAPPWAAGLRVVACHNEQIRYTSMPFEYEDPRHPRMVALRRKYNLDAVVAPATSETERLVRLRDWVAHQWQYQPPAKDYPAWDADEILRRKIGFCVQYAIVMMQAAVSLGHQARFVFGHNPGGTYEGGHECCEVWSNEHAKWVFYDVHQNWHYVDPRSQVPMNLLEVHDLVMKTYYAGRPVTLANRPHERLPTDGIAICYGRSMAPGMPAENCASHYAGGRYTAPTRWLFVNCVPRNNFYAHAYPQPKQQGCEWWAWSGYWCWQDAQTPTQWLFGRFTGRRSDLDWTLNQVHFAATVTDRPGELAVQMGTVTPYFQTFRVCMDGQGWQDSPRAFTWPLHTGRNRLEMRVRNTAGVEGPPSFLEVDRPQM
jgi:transglutaminase-like putative cysteine protease